MTCDWCLQRELCSQSIDKVNIYNERWNQLKIISPACRFRSGGTCGIGREGLLWCDGFPIPEGHTCRIVFQPYFYSFPTCHREFTTDLPKQSSEMFVMPANGAGK